MKISACLLTRGEKSISDAVRSIQPLVDEIILVDTDPSHEGPPRVVDTLFCANVKVARYDLCNFQEDCGCGCLSKRGEIADFAAARNYSFEMSTGDYCLWLDADDTVEGPVKKEALTDWAERVGRMSCRYLYSPTSRFIVPRLVPRRDRWKYPIHEMLDVPWRLQGVAYYSSLVWVHHRSSEAGVASAKRNFRLLTHHMNVSAELYRHDARMWYFYGRACLDLKQPIAALPKLERAFELETWDEQRANIATDLARGLPTTLRDLSLDWAWRAARCRPDWPSVWFTLASLYEGLQSQNFRNHGLSLPPSNTILNIDPSEQDREAQK
jgi:glycosyltransferase involved in cell wall biosynthesis